MHFIEFSSSECSSLRLLRSKIPFSILVTSKGVSNLAYQNPLICKVIWPIKITNIKVRPFNWVLITRAVFSSLENGKTRTEK